MVPDVQRRAIIPITITDDTVLLLIMNGIVLSACSVDLHNAIPPSSQKLHGLCGKKPV